MSDDTARAQSQTSAPLTSVVQVSSRRPLSPATGASFEVRDLDFFYGRKQALSGIRLDAHAHQVTALIGPSGCGKTTFLRCLDRMNDMIPGARVHGSVRFGGAELYGRGTDPIALRRRIGMVFQRPNPFPASIWENVARAARYNGVHRSELPGLVESSLRRAALWDEVKDKLKQSAFSLSGGQQQRLCIARTISVRPDAILMDEPCGSLDPVATAHIEELLDELKRDYTIVIVTHSLQQAARCSDRTAFFTAEGGPGLLVEVDGTARIFTTPSDERTEAYVTGRFG
ncbi:MAG: phosphate ABC transporter ATP-binding protein PstB [Acidimicrobiales bacterium]